MSTAHGKQPEELTPEQEEDLREKQKYTDLLTKEDTESVFSPIFKYALAMGWGIVKSNKEQFERFETISNAHLSEVLLDPSNSQNLTDAKELFNTVKNEFDAQNWDPRTKTYKNTTATRSSLKGGKVTISVDTLTKAEQQIIVGEQFHSLVNLHERNTRIDQAASLYGIGNKEEFADNLSRLIKEKPDINFDTALHTAATNQFTFEQTGKEDGTLTDEQKNRLDSSQKKLIEKKLKEEAHQKAIEYGNTIKSEAEGVMTKVQATKTGLDPDQFKTEVNAIGKPLEEPALPPNIVQIIKKSPQTTTDQPVFIANEATIGGLQPSSTVSTVTSAPMGGGGPPISIPPPKGLKGLLGKASGVLGKASRLLEKASSLLSSVVSKVGGLLPGIGQAIKALEIAKHLPVIGKALEKLYKSLIGELSKTALNLALKPVLIVGGLFVAFILIFIAFFSDPSSLHGILPNPGSVSNRSNLSWKTFESDYLQIARKKEEKSISWDEFQNQFLSSSKVYLSETSSH